MSHNFLYKQISEKPQPQRLCNCTCCRVSTREWWEEEQLKTAVLREINARSARSYLLCTPCVPRLHNTSAPRPRRVKFACNFRFSQRFWREILVEFSVSDTQTLKNVARGKFHRNFHVKFHDTFGREKPRKISLRTSAG